MNRFKYGHQMARAQALANALEQVGCKSDEALDLDETAWSLAEAAGQIANRPTSETTRSMAVTLLKAREEVIEDPFRGLPKAIR